MMPPPFTVCPGQPDQVVAPANRLPAALPLGLPATAASRLLSCLFRAGSSGLATPEDMTDGGSS